MYDQIQGSSVVFFLYFMDNCINLFLYIVDLSKCHPKIMYQSKTPHLASLLPWIVFGLRDVPLQRINTYNWTRESTIGWFVKNCVAKIWTRNLLSNIIYCPKSNSLIYSRSNKQNIWIGWIIIGRRLLNCF
jgi:hypothetical protein